MAQQIGINHEQSCSHNASLQIPKSDSTLHSALLNEISSDGIKHVKPLKSKLLLLLKDIECQINNTFSFTELKAAEKLLLLAKSNLSISATNESLNATPTTKRNIEKQRSFNKPKKKSGKKPKVHYAYPSNKQRTDIEAFLLNTPPTNQETTLGMQKCICSNACMY